jgi:hypothetical protein
MSFGNLIVRGTSRFMSCENNPGERNHALNDLMLKIVRTSIVLTDVHT